MARRITQEEITRIKDLRSRGWSLPEIHTKTKIGYGSVFRYIQNIPILPQYKSIWQGKRGGSKKRKQKLEVVAYTKAEKIISVLNEKEKILFLAALYWGEGGKKDFNFTNSDPEMIRIFVDGIKNILNISPDEIRVSIRIYEDLDREKSLDYWSKIVDIPKNKFVNVDVLKGKKIGKLKYGLCRVRIKKGGNMLKYLLALNNRVSEIF